MGNSEDGKTAGLHDAPDTDFADHGGKVMGSIGTPARNEVNVLRIEKVYRYVVLKRKGRPSLTKNDRKIDRRIIPGTLKSFLVSS